MTTLLITHPASLNHLNGTGHPERPDRIRAIESMLEQEKFQPLVREQAPMAELETVALCHPMDYVEEIRNAAPKEGMVQLDADTSMSPGTFEAALRAVGGATRAVDEVVAKKAANAFVAHAAARPSRRDGAADGLLHLQPGRDRGALRAEEARPASRRRGRFRRASRQRHAGDLLVRSDVMYCSTHQMPLYPGTGAIGERGDHDNIVNAPLRAGDGGEQFRAAMESRILPRLRRSGPS